MDGPIRQIRDFASHILAKENSHPLSPPPAYTPNRQPLDLRTITARQLEQQREAQPRPILIDSTPVAEFLTGSAIDDASSEMGDDESSPIFLRINTSIKVSNNNNVLCIGSTPADSAKQIAEAVVKAMRDYSAGNAGLPMIDEEGRPRPVKIDVDAGVTVEGANNFLGSKEVFQQFLEVQKNAPRAQRRRREESDEEADEAAGPSKRTRSTD
ncbi:rRNA-processing protein UTP23 [Purpureocillium lavendulum]|uniref:rRNA-processing protein UTP23 n=1 Tax=Purpureocillium lavendulum TaxID=1247861 RepID=A0AB34G6D1_9HYPO|nr:rRNA-processing protein UTP23 [Purpureocillium lavendulum]